MNLKDARKAANWTQAQLSTASRVPQQKISLYENGRIGRMSLQNARKILKALHRAGLKGLTYDDLFPAAAEERRAS